jgi:hypothetical protein
VTCLGWLVYMGHFAKILALMFKDEIF